MYEFVDHDDHEVQRASDAAANAIQENVIEENEEVASTKIAVDDEPKDKITTDPETGSFNRKTELPALLSATMGSNVKGNHQLTAKKGGKRNEIKSKDVGGVESHDTGEEENLTSLEEKSKLLLYGLYHYTIKKTYIHRFYSVLWQFPKKSVSVQYSRLSTVLYRRVYIYPNSVVCFKRL